MSTLLHTRRSHRRLRARCALAASCRQRAGADHVDPGRAGHAGDRRHDPGRRLGQHQLQRLRHGRDARQRELRLPAARAAQVRHPEHDPGEVGDSVGGADADREGRRRRRVARHHRLPGDHVVRAGRGDLEPQPRRPGVDVGGRRPRPGGAGAERAERRRREGELRRHRDGARRRQRRDLVALHAPRARRPRRARPTNRTASSSRRRRSIRRCGRC